MKEHIVTEVLISSVTTLENEVSMPCVMEFLPKSGKTGRAMSASLLSTFKTGLEICAHCAERVPSKEHILSYIYTTTRESHCNDCLTNMSLCADDEEQGHTSHLPCSRACSNCLQRGELCVRLVFLVLTADCEEGNKAASQIIKKSIEDASIDPELSLLSIIPEVPHVGKSLKAGFSIWFLKLRNELSNLAVIRSLRNRSTDDVKRAVRKLNPKDDHVPERGRDRQDPSAVLSLPNESLLTYVSSTGQVSKKITPETSKFTTENRPGM